ncbi:hypothetical protein KCP69_12560 [Salmonella enterica subsp. enterica]|nr:hypothetical protein KCP69_12560 [Salmonella enterica subsp. enterica]
MTRPKRAEKTAGNLKSPRRRWVLRWHKRSGGRCHLLKSRRQRHTALGVP